MRFAKLIVLSSLALFGIVGAFAEGTKKERVLACNMNALTKAQRISHTALTKALLEHSTRKEIEGGYEFTVDPDHISVAQLAQWVANESRCCPAVDFHLDLPASGSLTLRLDGGREVKEFIAAELGL